MSIDSEQRTEIEAARQNFSSTCRPTVAKLEERMFQPIQCLDHGFVRLIDYMGDDSSIVQAARVSYGKGTKTVRQDRGLIRYLLRHRHANLKCVSSSCTSSFQYLLLVNGFGIAPPM